MAKDLSILIVDDAKFSTAVIRKMLLQRGFSNVRHADSAMTALQLLEAQPADMVIADWLMPEMDGLALTQRIRQVDEQKNRYTYVILLTAKEGDDSLLSAFENGVDDFISKSQMNTQLIPRVMAAMRIVHNQNRLLAENTRLIEANMRLAQLSTVDAVSQLGNRQYAAQRLADTLRHVESREGAACLVVIRLRNFEDYRKRFPLKICNQLVLGFSRRLKQLVRPLDIVVRIKPDLFAIITHQPSIAHCTEKSFRRIYDSLNGRAFKTEMEFISVNAQMLVYAAHKDTGLPDAESMLLESEKRIRSTAPAFELGAAIHQGSAGSHSA